MCLHSWEHPGITQGYFAPTYPQIRDIFYPTIEEVAHTLGLRVDIKVSDKEVHFYSGRQYRHTTICRSMDKPQNIVGFKIGHALVDELDVMEADKARHSWRKIIARMRYNNPDLKNGIDVTTTPEGFKFTHEMFKVALAEKPELAKTYGIIQASTLDNAQNLPDDYIQSLYDAYPAELISAYINGQFVNLTSGTVYKSYDRTVNRSTETIQPKDALYIGMDFNVTKMAATVYVKRGEVWHAVAEIVDGYDTPDMSRIIKERWQDNGHRIVIYPDASGQNRTTKGASQSDISILSGAGFEVRAKPTNPAVKDRINAANRAFERCMVMVNDKECPVTARCLEQQAYDKNGEPDKSAGNDHQNDATTYPLAYEMPIHKPMFDSSVISFSY